MTAMIRRLAYGIAALMLGLVTAQASERRIALVIGNSNYTTTTRLPNAKTDALAIATALQKLKFEVEIALDTNADQLQRAVRKFTDDARSGVKVAVLFYAGHGLEIQGRNQLLPIDTGTTAPNGRVANALLLDDAIQALHESNPGLTIALIDACRNDLNDPSQGASVDRAARPKQPVSPRGVVRVQQKKGDVVVAYSTARGKLASDGAADHSPFAASLLRHIATPELPIERLLDQVTADVERDTAGRQRPWLQMSKTSPFSFASSASSIVTGALSAPSQSRADPRVAMLQQCDQLYRSAALSDDKLTAYQPYLNQCVQHPKFAEAERDWLLEVERKECTRLQGGGATAITDLQLYLQRYKGGLCEPTVKVLLDQKMKVAIAPPQPTPSPRTEPTPEPTPRSAPSMPVVIAPSVSRQWNHNGSTMKLVADGSNRRFFYDSPRAGIRAEGVTPGTLLFEGQRIGDTYSGTAYIFSRVCGRIAYQVSGEVSGDQRSVTMFGQAPRPSSNCQIVGYREDTLVFELIGE